MRNHRFMILTAALLSLTAAATTHAQNVVSPAPGSVKLAACTRNLEAIGRALKAYRRDHHNIPDHLTDLYPRYIRDVHVFRCPADGGAMASLPSEKFCSYLYEMDKGGSFSYAGWLPPDGLPGELGRLRQGTDIRVPRQFYQAMRVHYGDLMPVVSCWNHKVMIGGATQPGSVLMLLGDGRIRRGYHPDWDIEPDILETVLSRIEVDLDRGTATFEARWEPIRLEKYMIIAGGQRGAVWHGLPAIPPRLCAHIRAVGSHMVTASARAPAITRNNLLRTAAMFYAAAGDRAGALKTQGLGRDEPDLAALSLARIFQCLRDRSAEIAALDRQLAAPGSHLLTLARRAAMMKEDGRAGAAAELLKDRLSVERQGLTVPKSCLPYALQAAEALLDIGGSQSARFVRAFLDHYFPNHTDDVQIMRLRLTVASVDGDYTSQRELLLRLGDVGSLSWVAYTRGDLSEAKRLFEQTHNNVGQALIAMIRGDDRTARILMERELAGREKTYPKDDWIFLNTCIGALGRIAERDGRYDDAEQLFLRALAVERRSNMPGHAPATLEGLGNVAYDRGELQKAKHWLSQAQEIDPNSALANYYLARPLEESGDRKEALRHLSEAARILDGNTRNSRYAVEIYRYLARLDEEDGRPDDAQKHLRRAEGIAADLASQLGGLVDTPETARPQVQFLSPQPNSVIQGDRVIVSFAIVSPLPIARYRVWINGRPFGGDKGFELPEPKPKSDVRDRGQILEKGQVLEKGDDRAALAASLPSAVADLVRKVQFSHYAQIRTTLPLEDTDGEYIRIAIVAETTGGISSSRQILRLRRPQATANRGALRVLTIGVGEYQNLPKLRFAAADAVDLGQAFREQAGENRLYDGAFVTSLADSNATIAQIREALDAFARNVRPGDTLILALSGHGLRKGDATYFAPVRCDPENIDGTGLPWKEVLVKLEEARKTAKAVWVLADCCRAAPGLRRDVTAATSRDLKKDVEEGGNLIICSASSGDTPSYESEDIKHGIFTAAWLEALSGRAPSLVYEEVPRGKVLTLSGLQFALDSATRKMARAVGVRQIIEFPQLVGSFSPSTPVFVPVSTNH